MIHERKIPFLDNSTDFIRAFQHDGQDDIQQLTRQYFTDMMYYECAQMEIETKFNVLNKELSMGSDRNPISTIKSRIKRPSSIIDKLKRYGVPVTLESMVENLNDIVGVRVVCTFPEDVYRIADAFLQQDDITVLSIKDYIKNPKKNGYRSLHVIISIPIFLQKGRQEVKAEIQFRTIAMDCWASLEHQIFYKRGISITEDEVKKLKACADISAELDEKMNALRKQLVDKSK